MTGTDLAADDEQTRALYRERAHLIAALARIAVLDQGRDAVIAYNDPREPALPVLYAHTAAGQISWHLNPEHLRLLPEVPVVDAADPRARWDGHDKETALQRLLALAQGVHDHPWTVDLAEKALRQTQPAGRVFLRHLINEGGTATAERMRELTGSAHLGPMRATLNAAARKTIGRPTFHVPGRRHLIESRPDPNNPSSPAVYDYTLPTELLDIFDQALRRLAPPPPN